MEINRGKRFVQERETSKFKLGRVLYQNTSNQNADMGDSINLCTNSARYAAHRPSQSCHSTKTISGKARRRARIGSPSNTMKGSGVLE
jgi:hypothetical protein